MRRPGHVVDRIPAAAQAGASRAEMWFTDETAWADGMNAADPKHPDKHWMVTCPAYSPENGGLCAGPAMDNGILRDLFSQTAKASEILGTDADFRKKILALVGA